MLIDIIVICISISKQVCFAYIKEEAGAVCDCIGDEDHLPADIVELLLKVMIVGAHFQVVLVTIAIVIRVYKPYFINLV